MRQDESVYRISVRIRTSVLTVLRHRMADARNVGFGGSNAAVILEEAPTIPRLSDERANGTEHTNGTEYAKDTGLTNGTMASAGNGVVTHDHLSHDSVQRLFVLSAKSESSLTSYLSSFVE
jgi:acyl transferase domain-containing protein